MVQRLQARVRAASSAATWWKRSVRDPRTASSRRPAQSRGSSTSYSTSSTSARGHRCVLHCTAIQSVPRNSEPTCQHVTTMFCVVTDALPVVCSLLLHAVIAGSTLSRTFCIISLVKLVADWTEASRLLQFGLRNTIFVFKLFIPLWLLFSFTADTNILWTQLISNTDVTLDSPANL